MGTGVRPVPWFEPPAGATDAGGAPHSRSGFAEAQRDEPRRVTRLHPHEDRALALFLRFSQRAAYIGGIGNLLAAHLENDITGLDALIGGNPVGVDLGDDYPFRAATGDLAGRHDREAEPRHIRTFWAGGVRRRRPARLPLIGQFAQGNREGLLLTLAPHRQLRGRTRCQTADLPREVSGVLHRAAIHGRDNLTGHDARLGGRAISLRFGHKRALRRFQTKIVRDLGGDWLDLHTDSAAGDFAVLLELGHDRLHSRSRDRKSYADRTARRREDGRVDANHVAVHIESRPAGIAFVDRGIDLNEVVVRSRPDVAAARRNDTGRHGPAEAERITDRQHPIADARRLVGELHIREIAAALDFDKCNVGARIGTDYLRGVGFPVVGSHLHRIGLIDDVVVGHGVTVGADKEAGALAGHEALARPAARLLGIKSLRRAEAAEEAFDVWRERRIALEAHHCGAARSLDANRDDSWLHLLDDVGKSHRALNALRVSD